MPRSINESRRVALDYAKANFYTFVSRSKV